MQRVCLEPPRQRRRAACEMDGCKKNVSKDDNREGGKKAHPRIGNERDADVRVISPSVPTTCTLPEELRHWYHPRPLRRRRNKQPHYYPHLLLPLDNVHIQLRRPGIPQEGESQGRRRLLIRIQTQEFPA
jgi:hypothetical protein